MRDRALLPPEVIDAICEPGERLPLEQLDARRLHWSLVVHYAVHLVAVDEFEHHVDPNG